ncbi:probable cytochrome P450 49a1 [Hetaerina americana]|uniref:probable cytochrome P450 49a1 n=1 Tax=Hetaerina americana TaxID=62018 RepID=UPI003A7F50D3
MAATATSLHAVIRHSQAMQRAAAVTHFPRGNATSRQRHTGDLRMSAIETVATTKISDVKPFEEIPGPTLMAMIGNLWRFLPFIGAWSGGCGGEVFQAAGHGSCRRKRCRGRGSGEILDSLRALNSEVKRVGDVEGADVTPSICSLAPKIDRRPLVKMYEEYGPILKVAGLPGRPDMVFAFRPEDAEVVLRNDGPWPSRGTANSLSYYRNVTRKDYFGGASGVITEDGPKWLETRRKVNPPLMQPRISNRYIAPIADVAQDFVDRMRTLRDHKDELPAEFHNELFKWSLESIAYVALNTRLGCLASNLAPDSEPQRLIDAVSVFFETSFQLDSGIPLWKIFPTRSWKKFVNALDLFLEISEKYVKQAIERVERQSGEGVEWEASVLERLLARGTPKEACVMAQDMLFGGVDSTSYSVASALYMMCKNQDKQEMLLKELKKYLPRKEDTFSEEILEDMKYLKAVIKETLRVAAPFNGILRVLPKEIVIGNYKVPAGVPVFLPSVITKFSEEFFPQSDKFIPERWLKTRPTANTAGSVEDFDATNKTKRHPFAYIPFGFGARSCVGKRFADMEIQILLAKIVRNFQVEYKYGEIKYEDKMLYKPKDPLRFKLTERDS